MSSASTNGLLEDGHLLGSGVSEDGAAGERAPEEVQRLHTSERGVFEGDEDDLRSLRADTLNVSSAVVPAGHYREPFAFEHCAEAAAGLRVVIDHRHGRGRGFSHSVLPGMSSSKGTADPGSSRTRWTRI